MPAVTTSDSRSSSPAPAPPIADTPGPRAQGLINIFHQATRATLDKCSPTNFATCFPTAAEYSPEVLEHLRTQIVDQLERTWTTNFDDIMARRNVIQLLNSLDQCIDDARLRKKRAEASENGGPVEKPIPPHTLPPSDIYLAHLMPFLEKQAAEMNARLVQTQEANTELLNMITTQRAEIGSLVKSLENVVHDLEASALAMGQDDVQGLSIETRNLEMELRK